MVEIKFYAAKTDYQDCVLIRVDLSSSEGTIKGVRSLFGNLGSNSGFSLLHLSIGFTFFGVSPCHVPADRILQGASTML